jgi:hypothetical protein
MGHIDQPNTEMRVIDSVLDGYPVAVVTVYTDGTYTMFRSFNRAKAVSYAREIEFRDYWGRYGQVGAVLIVTPYVAPGFIVQRRRQGCTNSVIDRALSHLMADVAA